MLLQRINATSKSLQTINKTLQCYVKKLHDEFSIIEEITISLSFLTLKGEDSTCNRYERKIFFDKGECVKWSVRQNFIINTFNIICDSLIEELSRRKEVYENIFL